MDPVAQLAALARRIRHLRERAGLTQEELAEKSGISVSFASLLERGERSPSYETLLQIADALGVTPGALFEPPEEDASAALRLVDFVRARGLSRAQVTQWLAVGDALFPDGLEDSAPRESLCTAPECTKPVLAKGLCVAHYHRARRAR